MRDLVRKTRVISDLKSDRIPYGDLLRSETPAILKGLARDWPLVRHGLQSPRQAMDYLKSFYSGKKIICYVGSPGIKGRFFYSEDMTGLNYSSEWVQLDAFLDRVGAHMNDPAADSLYIGSTTVDTYLPGLRAENDLVLDDEMFRHNKPLVSIWLGNRTVASAHYDLSNNIACCAVGHRRFTLFPPGQIDNLYPGPLEPTPGGQVVSMVDFNNPDFGKYPRFRDALAAGQVAEMEPGDVLFYPSMWWHHVEALDEFNVLINYWWNTTPDYIDTPRNTLLHALLSLRDRPPHEKEAWRRLFEYYVFGPAERAGAHLPEHIRGDLAPMDEPKSRRLRAYLLKRLNR
jgi:hypothetical protein